MKKGFGLKSGLMLSLMFGAGVACAAVTPVSGSIATIAKSEGMVLVNQGKYYVTARPGQQLSVGDRIMTMAGASASIAYKDGCVQQLKPNNKLVFNSVAECSTKTAKIQSVGPHYAALGGGDGDGDGGGGGGGSGGGGGGFFSGLGVFGASAFGAGLLFHKTDNPISAH